MPCPWGIDIPGVFQQIHIGGGATSSVGICGSFTFNTDDQSLNYVSANSMRSSITLVPQAGQSVIAPGTYYIAVRPWTYHAYSKADLRTIGRAIQASATSCLFTTEKDAQRLRDCRNVPQSIRERLFYVPVEAAFLTEEEQAAFTAALLTAL